MSDVLPLKRRGQGHQAIGASSHCRVVRDLQETGVTGADVWSDGGIWAGTRRQADQRLGFCRDDGRIICGISGPEDDLSMVVERVTDVQIRNRPEARDVVADPDDWHRRFNAHRRRRDIAKVGHWNSSICRIEVHPARQHGFLRRVPDLICAAHRRLDRPRCAERDGVSGVVQNSPHFSGRDPSRYPYDLARQTGPGGGEGDVIVDQGAGASRVGCVEVVADKSAGVSDVRDFGKAVGIELRGDRRGSVDRIKPQIDMP